MLPKESQLSSISVIETLATVYTLSADYHSLRERLYQIELNTFSPISTENIDLITGSIQDSILQFFMNTGSMLHDNFLFEPFVNINFHSGLCNNWFVPFAVTLLFGYSDPEVYEDGEEVQDPDCSSFAMHFNLRIDEENRVVLSCV